jgi:hypothetical protein
MLLVGAAFVGVFCLGAIFLTPIAKRRFHGDSDLNSMLSNYLQYFGIIYGLLLGLLAIGTYENFTDTEKAVANEAAALLALYRTGTLICLIALLDNPYRGDDEVSVSPRAFELAYQQMLQD